MRIGAHLDQSDVIAQAQALGADVAQIFLGDPQSWKGPEFTYPGGAEALKADAEAADLQLVVHAPYVINVASTNNRIRIPSRKLLQQMADGAAAVGATGLVVHGGHVTAKDDPAKGFDNWRKAIDALETDVIVYVENTAGGDFSMARRLERIEGLWGAIQQADGADKVGFCLDTCHAWAGGIDLATAVEQVTAITGRLDLVHLNNSRDAAGSGADRHASLTAGTIEPELLLGVVKAAGTSVVCETHADVPADVAWLRESVG